MPINPSAENTPRIPDCVTETRIGNTILIVSGFFKYGAAETAVDKMARVIKSEESAQYLIQDEENTNVDRFLVQESLPTQED